MEGFEQQGLDPQKRQVLRESGYFGYNLKGLQDGTGNPPFLVPETFGELSTLSFE